MQRLILAAIVAYLLLPEEFAPRMVGGSDENTPVSAGEAMSAAQDMLEDLGSFCARNPNACETGEALVAGAKRTVLEGLDGNAENLPSNPEN